MGRRARAFKDRMNDDTLDKGKNQLNDRKEQVTNRVNSGIKGGGRPKQWGCGPTPPDYDSHHEIHDYPRPDSGPPSSSPRALQPRSKRLDSATSTPRPSWNPCRSGTPSVRKSRRPSTSRKSSTWQGDSRPRWPSCCRAESWPTAIRAQKEQDITQDQQGLEQFYAAVQQGWPSPTTSWSP